MCVQLSWDGGVSWTAAKATATLGTSMATFTLGGATDSWGRTWSAANLSDASFRVRVINVASSTSRDFFLDWVAVRPHLTASIPAAVNGVSLSPTSVTGGTSSTGTVTLAGRRRRVARWSRLPAATRSPRRYRRMSPCPAHGGRARSRCTVSDEHGASDTDTVVITVNAADAPATLTVTATGRSGERITSSPAGINAAVGSTGSAAFAIGTRITLTVSNGRDAIWSGAC